MMSWAATSCVLCISGFVFCVCVVLKSSRQYEKITFGLLAALLMNCAALILNLADAMPKGLS